MIKKINNVKGNNIKDLLISFFVFSSASVLGPLLVVGGIGFLIYKIYDTSIIVLIVSVLIAFILSNVLLFKKLKTVNLVIDKEKDKEIKRQKELVKAEIEEKNKNKNIKN